MKNIYDLEDNNSEFTVMASYQSNRVVRGNQYLSAQDGDFFPASNIYGLVPKTDSIMRTSCQTIYVLE